MKFSFFFIIIFLVKAFIINSVGSAVSSSTKHHKSRLKKWLTDYDLIDQSPILKKYVEDDTSEEEENLSNVKQFSEDEKNKLIQKTEKPRNNNNAPGTNLNANQITSNLKTFGIDLDIEKQKPQYTYKKPLYLGEIEEKPKHNTFNDNEKIAKDEPEFLELNVPKKSIDLDFNSNQIADDSNLSSVVNEKTENATKPLINYKTIEYIDERRKRSSNNDEEEVDKKKQIYEDKPSNFNDRNLNIESELMNNTYITGNGENEFSYDFNDNLSDNGDDNLLFNDKISQANNINNTYTSDTNEIILNKYRNPIINNSNEVSTKNKVSVMLAGMPRNDLDTLASKYNFKIQNYKEILTNQEIPTGDESRIDNSTLFVNNKTSKLNIGGENNLTINFKENLLIIDNDTSLNNEDTMTVIPNNTLSNANKEILNKFSLKLAEIIKSTMEEVFIANDNNVHTIDNIIEKKQPKIKNLIKSTLLKINKNHEKVKQNDIEIKISNYDRNTNFKQISRSEAEYYKNKTENNYDQNITNKKLSSQEFLGFIKPKIIDNLDHSDNSTNTQSIKVISEESNLIPVNLFQYNYTIPSPNKYSPLFNTKEENIGKPNVITEIDNQIQLTIPHKILKKEDIKEKRIQVSGDLFPSDNLQFLQQAENEQIDVKTTNDISEKKTFKTQIGNRELTKLKIENSREPGERNKKNHQQIEQSNKKKRNDNNFESRITTGLDLDNSSVIYEILNNI